MTFGWFSSVNIYHYEHRVILTRGRILTKKVKIREESYYDVSKMAFQ